MDIKGIIKKINMMDDNKEKFKLFQQLQQYLSFLLSINMITDDEIASLNKQIIAFSELSEKFYSSHYKLLEDLYMNLPYFNNIYRPILKNADKYPLIHKDYSYYNLDNLIDYALNFFKMMGEDVYRLYLKLLKEELILEKGPASYGGECRNIDGKSSSIVLNTNTTNLYKIICLVHEIGHAYDIFLNRNHDYKIDTQINAEITSVTFEHLFIKFLMDANVLKKEDAKTIYNNFFVQHLRLMHEAYVYNNLVLNNLIYPGAEFSLDSERAKAKYRKYSIMTNNVLTKDNQTISPTSNEYSFGMMISFIIMDHFSKNKQKTIQEIKDISTFSQVSNTNDIINLFTKTEYVNTISKNLNKILIKK